MADEDLNVWVNTKQASKILGVGPRSLYRMIDKEGLPAYKMGRVIRILQSDLYAFIESSKIEPGTLKHLYPDHNIY
jgi:excisionase family DNA binding protein